MTVISLLRPVITPGEVINEENINVSYISYYVPE